MILNQIAISLPKAPGIDPLDRIPVGLTAGVVALATLGLGLWIVSLDHPLYWWDAYRRLGSRHLVAVWVWLPLLQAVIYAVSRVTMDLAVLRLVMAGISAGMAIAAAALAARTFGRGAAFVTGVLVAFNWLFITLSTVPYQEPLFLLLLFGGLAFRIRGRDDPGPRGRQRAVLSSLALNLACMTRYEGWLMVGYLSLETFIAGVRTRGLVQALRQAARRFLMDGGVFIAVWMIWARPEAVSQDGTPLSLYYLGQYVREILTAAGPVPTVLAAVGGAVAIVSRRRDTGVRWLAAFLVLDALFVLVVNPFSAFNARRPFVPTMVLLVFAGFGAQWSVRSMSMLLRLAAPTSSTTIRAAAVTCMLIGAIGMTATRHVMTAMEWVARPSGDAATMTARAAGRWLESHADRQGSAVGGSMTIMQRLVMATYAGWSEDQIEIDAWGSPSTGAARLRRLLDTGRPVYIVSAAADLPTVMADLDEVSRWPETDRPTVTRIDLDPEGGEPVAIWSLVRR